MGCVGSKKQANRLRRIESLQRMVDGSSKFRNSNRSIDTPPIEQNDSRVRLNELFSLSPPSTVKAYSAIIHETLPQLVAPAHQRFPYLRLRYSIYSTQGERPTMEDEHKIFPEPDNIAREKSEYAFFGVYDGHGGSDVSTELKSILHEKVIDKVCLNPQPTLTVHERIKCACREVDDYICHLQEEDEKKNPEKFVGSTAIFALVERTRVFVGGVGDSQAVLSRNGVAEDLLPLHKPANPDELNRITDVGGIVKNNRVFDMLAVSRAFGDLSLKTSRGDFKHKFDGDVVSCEPDIHEFAITAEDEFLVLACDGLFEVLKPQQVVTFIKTCLRRTPDLQLATQKLVEYALSRHTKDNVSVIVIGFNQDFKHLASAASVNFHSHLVGHTRNPTEMTDLSSLPIEEDVYPYDDQECNPLENEEKHEPYSNVEFDLTENNAVIVKNDKLITPNEVVMEIPQEHSQLHIQDIVRANVLPTCSVEAIQGNMNLNNSIYLE